MADYHIIRENKTLHQIFTDEVWRSVFYASALNSAETVVKAVSNIEIYKYNAKTVIEADVEENNGKVFYTEANFIFDRTGLKLACDCNCSAPDNCKHAAAVLGAVAQRIKNGTTLLNLGLDDEVGSWLVDLEMAEKTPETKSKKAKNNHFLAYCLLWEPDSLAAPVLEIHKGKSLKSGVFIDSTTTPAADPTKPSSFMDDKDNYPCLLIKSVKRLMYPTLRCASVIRFWSAPTRARIEVCQLRHCRAE